MNCVELSLENLNKESKKLAQNIEKNFTPDLIIYIARGGYLIGKTIADYFGVDLIGIHAERKGGGIKELVSPLLRHFPQWLKLSLRRLELSSGIHQTQQERNVYWDISERSLNAFINRKNILLVDDSVDTGHSMLAVIETIKNIFGPQIILKTAAINCWKKSQSMIKINYYNYVDTIIETPMSKDSKEYSIFEKIYNTRK